MKGFKQQEFRTDGGQSDSHNCADVRGPGRLSSIVNQHQAQLSSCTLVLLMLQIHYILERSVFLHIMSSYETFF